MGIPGAGKTSLAQWMSEHAPFSAKCITFDDFLPDSNLSLKDRHHAIFQQVHALLGAEPRATIVILDDNMHLKSMRKPYWRLCQRLGVGLAFLHIMAPLAECITRDRARHDPVGSETIRRMHAAFEDLTRVQSPFSLVIDSGSSRNYPGLLDDLQRVLLASQHLFLNHPPQSTDKGRSPPPQNPVHEIHLALNRRAHEIISRHPREKERVLSLKAKLLAKFKANPTMCEADLLEEFKGHGA